ncbi:hypothetical protein ACOMHN_029807 [Nucella lapillus]
MKRAILFHQFSPPYLRRSYIHSLEQRAPDNDRPQRSFATAKNNKYGVESFPAYIPPPSACARSSPLSLSIMTRSSALFFSPLPSPQHFSSLLLSFRSKSSLGHQWQAL